jgi:hypothetical protein
MHGLGSILNTGGAPREGAPGCISPCVAKDNPLGGLTARPRAPPLLFPHRPLQARHPLDQVRLPLRQRLDGQLQQTDAAHFPTDGLATLRVHAWRL